MTYGSPLSCVNHTVENAGFTNLSTFDGFGHKGKKEEKKSTTSDLNLGNADYGIQSFALCEYCLKVEKKNMKKNVTTAARKTPKKQTKMKHIISATQFLWIEHR